MAGTGAASYVRWVILLGRSSLRHLRAARIAGAGKALPSGLPETGNKARRRDFRKTGMAIAWDPAAQFGAREVPHMAGDSLFGVHGAALEVRSQRMGVLASNIANASTPGFKARDVDFQAALASMESGANGAGDRNGIAAATKYRVPTQTSMDGNTVELNAEQTAFAENAVQYQTTLSFLNGRISQVTRALKGE
jgi:flagellar basal-body rod protein FlgB